jgi:hypoxanthine-DNA glycosylase
MRDVEAVVFDMDGLMFDSERIVKYAWNVAGNVLGYGDIGENIVHTLGLNRADREKYFKHLYGQDFPFERFQKLTKEAYDGYVEEHGMMEKPGLYELVAFLKKHGIKMAVATSASREHAERVLKKKHLFDLDAFVCGDMVSRSKPDPEIYETACRRLSVSPGKAVALEDAPNGIRAAYYAGLLAIMIPDLVPCGEEIRPMLAAEYSSLSGVIDYLLGYDHVSHGFPPVYDSSSRILILGSFPSVKSREGQFYYHHPQNRFWKVLSSLLEVPLPETIEEKKEMLRKGHIAVWDVIESCDIIGSADSTIKNVKTADIGKLLAETAVTEIYVNGKKAESLYRKYCEPLTGIKAKCLPSTSPANAGYGMKRLRKEWKVILDGLQK